MSSWEGMKAAVVRGAERELELSMKPGTDAQICGPFWDVQVEGTYLGWCSKKQRDELQLLYDKTPSKLRREPLRTPSSLDGVSTQVALALKKCRQIEADAVLGEHRPGTPAEVSDLRCTLEVLHETVLTLVEAS